MRMPRHPALRRRQRGYLRIGLGRAIFGGWHPRKWFQAGEVGDWWDDTDATCIRQDAAGSTAAALESPVGLQLGQRYKGRTDTYGGYLRGVAGSYFSTPDSAASSITGSIDIRVKAALTDWTAAGNQTLIAKYDTASNQRSYNFLVEAVTGNLLFFGSQVGTAADVHAISTVAPTVADGATLWVRVTCLANNGSGGSTTTFYTSIDGSSWTQLGSAVVTAGGVSGGIFNSTAPVEVGTQTVGTVSLLAGKIYRAQVYNGIAGTLAVDFDPSRYTTGSAFAAATGETWTIQGNAYIAHDGIHWYQTTSANRPTWTAKYNILIASQEIYNGVWTASGCTTASTPVTGPDGDVVNAARLVSTSAASDSMVTQNTTPPASVSGRSIVYVRRDNNDWVALSNSSHFAYFNISTGVTGTIQAGTASIEAAGNSWWKLTWDQPAGAFGTLRLRLASANGAPTGNAVGQAAYWFKADSRLSCHVHAGIPSYQRVGIATDYDTVGFPAWVKANGTNSFMQTSAVDFSGSDKMTRIWAGYKASDATGAIALELSAATASNAGSFYLSAPEGAAATFGSLARGDAAQNSNQVATASSQPAPKAAVIVATDDIVGDLSTLTVNGVAATSATGNKGSGNFGNYPLYRFSRGGVSTWMNGGDSAFLIRGGTIPPAAQLERAARFFANKGAIAL